MAGFRLIDLWMDSDLCVVVDAMDAGEEPGTVKEFDAEQVMSECLPEKELAVSSHGVRLKEALEIGTALGPPYIPGQVRVFGIQVDAGRTQFGNAGLSPQVCRACDQVVDRVRAVCLGFDLIGCLRCTQCSRRVSWQGTLPCRPCG